VFSGSNGPHASAIIESFRRYGTKVFDANAMAYRKAASTQGKDSDEALNAMARNLLSDVFGSEWESSPGEQVVRIDWQQGIEGWKGREVVVIAGNDPDKNCLYHELISDAIKYRYRFHAVPPEPIPGEPRGINLSNLEWWQYIGLKERHNLAMAIKPYLEDRVGHWQLVYKAPGSTDAGSSIETAPEQRRPATSSDPSEPIPTKAAHPSRIRVLPRSEYRAWLTKLKALAVLAWRYRRRSIVPSVSALQRLHVDAMDLLLGIGPSVSQIREELGDLRLANYGSQREDWREAHVYPLKIRRFTKLLIAAHHLLEREQRANRVAATDRAAPFRAAGVEKTVGQPERSGPTVTLKTTAQASSSIDAGAKESVQTRAEFHAGLARAEVTLDQDLKDHGPSMEIARNYIRTAMKTLWGWSCVFSEMNTSGKCEKYRREGSTEDGVPERMSESEMREWHGCLYGAAHEALDKFVVEFWKERLQYFSTVAESSKAEAPATPEAAIITTTGQAPGGQHSVLETTAAVGVKSDATKQEDAKQRPDNARKGDPTLLGEKLLVSFATAEQYLGLTERQRQKLIKSGALEVEGQGLNRKITTKSLRAYVGAEIPN
jgi:hypothetical protein